MFPPWLVTRRSLQVKGNVWTTSHKLQQFMNCDYCYLFVQIILFLKIGNRKQRSRLITGILNMFVYLKGRERNRLLPFYSSNCPQHLGIGPGPNQELPPRRVAGTHVIIGCLPGYTLAGGWNQEWSWDLYTIWDMCISNGILTTIPNAFPRTCNFNKNKLNK